MTERDKGDVWDQDEEDADSWLLQGHPEEDRKQLWLRSASCPISSDAQQAGQ